MHADVSARFWPKRLLAYPDPPILLCWAKAPWHQGPPIQRLLAAHPRLAIVYFPTAAPDLNPQAPVWKATRAAVSHHQRITKLDQLADAVEAQLISTPFPCPLLDQHDYLRFSMLFI